MLFFPAFPLIWIFAAVSLIQMLSASRRRLASTRHAVVLALFGVALFCGTVQAASTLNFPRLSFETGTFTGFAIVNPNNEAASVTFTARGTDGAILSGPGFQNPATLAVPANQQISKLAPEIFGASLSPSTIGWVQAVSTTDGLTGFFLHLDGGDTFLDGADLPVASTRLVFNQLRIGSGFQTEISIVNPGSAAASINLQISGTGSVPAPRAVTIPARGILRLDVATFFAAAALPDGAYLTAAGDNPVAGFQLIRSPQGEILGLNGRDTAEQMSNLYFPQMAVLGNWTTEIGVVNHASTAVILTLTAFRPDGAPHGPPSLQNNPVTRALAPGASLREDVAALFGFTGGAPVDGWIHVESTSPAVNGYLSYGAGKLLASVSTASAGLSRTIFSHIGTALGFFTGVAVLNPGTLAANVRIMAMQPSGTVLGTFDTVLQPGQRLSSLIHQLIPQAQGQAGGVIWIKSDRPVYSAELFGTANTLANVPGQPAPASYNPDVAVPSLRVTPPLAPVQTSAIQIFRAEGNSGTVTWKVNGLAGGDPSFGTISETGNYRAPTAVPTPQAITVTAESGSQAGGATVDVLSRLTLVGGLGVVQSVAFLSSSAKLFDAEIALLAGGKEAESVTSGVFEISVAGVKTPVATYSGELTAKMIPFTAQSGREFLLLAGQTTGRIIRLDPSTRLSVDVATGLNQPSSLVVDPVSGNLLVAEADRVSVIPRNQVETPSAKRAGPAERTATLFSTRADGIAVDACTGLVYISNGARGEIQEYNRILGTTRTVASGLRSPRGLLAIYRTGVTCPASIQLLVIEAGLDRIVQFDPLTGAVAVWIGAQAPSDLAFMGRATPFGIEERVLMSEAEGQSGSRIASIRTPGLYGPQPPNPPYPILGYSAAVTLALSPELTELAVGATQPFTARITGVPNTAVLFSTTGGTITDAGVLTAPLTPGTYKVTATSIAYPRISAEATVRVVAGGAGTITSIAGTGTAGFSGDGGPASAAQLNLARGMATDGAGNLYFADSANHRIRRISVSGTITTVAGNGIAGFSGDNGPATAAQLSLPTDVEVDAAGNLYVADFGNHRVRRISSGGIITTLAGTGTPGYNGDNRDPLTANLNSPNGVALDTHDNLYVADRDNHRVRVIGASRTFILTVAGNGQAGFSGDGGAAAEAQLNLPNDIVIGDEENTYIVDFGNNRIRRVNRQFVITTEAGTGTAGASGDGGTATAAQLNRPLRIARDAAGNLYVSDSGNNRVRRIAANGVMTTFAGTGQAGFSGDGGLATAAGLSAPEGVAVGATGLFISDRLNFRIRRVEF